MKRLIEETNGEGREKKGEEGEIGRGRLMQKERREKEEGSEGDGEGGHVWGRHDGRIKEVENRKR